MEQFIRIDAFDVTYADSFTRRELKIAEKRVHKDGSEAKKGVGEKRIYCGSDEDFLNDFFGFSDIKYFIDNKDNIYNDTYFNQGAKKLTKCSQCPRFFIQKDDLVEYFEHAKQEYEHPSFYYGKGMTDIMNIYREYEKKLNSLNDDRLCFQLLPKYDSQHRYYLKLPYRKTADTKAYNFIHDICLPRVSRLLFAKLVDANTGKPYIYIKPFFENDINCSLSDESVPQKKATYVIQRKWQEKYRKSILDYYPLCVVTNVSDEKLLEACHIKSHNVCNKAEGIDKYNGFTMTPTIHKLFDTGYLSFDKNGNMMLSPFLRNYDREHLNLPSNLKINIREQTKVYLEWHNKEIYKQPSNSVLIVPKKSE